MDIQTALKPIMTQEQIFADVASLVPEKGSCWLVGGAIRDALLGRKVADFDFATNFDPTAMARTFAAKRRGHFFFLDPERRQSRVVLADSGTEVDFTPLRAETIEQDLGLRDFTINAMAVPVSSGQEIDPIGLVDPLMGADDLDNGIIRQAFPETFTEDPLRIIKGVRHAVVLGFIIDEPTITAMSGRIAGLNNIAAERIGSEWMKILSAQRGVDGLDLLAKLPFWSQFIESGSEKIDAGLERLKSMSGEIDLYLDELIQAQTIALDVVTEWLPLFRQGIFFSLLDTKEVKSLLATSFRLSKKVANQIVAHCSIIQEPPALPATSISSRGEALWLVQLSGDSEITLNFLTAIIDRSVRERVPSLLRSYRKHLYYGRIPDIVPAEYVQKVTGLKGRALGELLMTVRSAEIDGEIGSVAEAQYYLKKLRSI